MALAGLRGRRALVTGAGRGIGAAIASRLADEGVSLAINDVDAGACLATVEQAQSAGVPCIAAPGDVSDRTAARHLVATAVEELGGLDILVNNAGVDHRASVAEYADEAWRRVMEVNLDGPFWMAQAAHPHLASSGVGAIVNLCSIAVIGATGQVAYDASKGALLTVTRSLAFEFGPQGIRVNAVCPGFIDTEMASDKQLRRMGDAVTATLPIQRWGTPDDVAATVAWLASDEASFTTGQAIFVDGGFVRY